ncbi:TfoX/Sxy family protein [Arcticibacterium luteifluviistationis]|uniref:RNA methyltransferase n=1 Tax=Arcticibacterium luteifluviistationis TaxID=1784714 RepID=A0A2Z4GHX5_9BACT|nr:TfoX/Sxy family protein [Arcticibacterium luteifluviistationis]AWW00566.1 RNA methyltransferase [Arcticibacterium luteifluviistationis]
MAYDEYLADRIRQSLKEKKTHFEEMKMMGGLCFKVDDKMLCGIHIDKKFGDSLLMARIGEEAYETEIKKENVLPMDFTGRPMKGYVFVTPLGMDSEEDLSYWVDKMLAFNPLAKATKKKKLKKKNS